MDERSVEGTDAQTGQGRTGQNDGRKGPRMLLFRKMKYLYFDVSTLPEASSHPSAPQS